MHFVPAKKIYQFYLYSANASSPCIIFFDELDAIVPRRQGGENQVTERVVNQLLTELDGLEQRKQIFIVAATNRPGA
jgi:ribosome biogenesis ATPase